jgi:L-arabinose transport system substrate-binding protein
MTTSVWRRAAIGVACTALALTAAACSSANNTAGSGGSTATTGSGSTATTSSSSGSGKISIAYIQKQASQVYFVGEKAGAQAEADKLGISISFFPLADQADDSAAVDAVNQAIAKKVNGIIIVPPDGAVGPTVTQLASAAGIKMMSSDDQVCTNNPDPTKCAAADLLPRVGFDGTEMGTDVGKEAAALFKQYGWNAADTAVVSAWGPEVTVCTQRVEAEKAAFTANGGSAAKMIDLNTDNTASGAQDKAAAMLTANQGFKHWVVWGCNDENVSGVVTAMQNAGINTNDIDGVALGGYLACKPWNANTPTGMKASLYISGADVGSTSVDVINDWLSKGTQPQQQTFAPTHMVTPDNWKTTMSSGDVSACLGS